MPRPRLLSHTPATPIEWLAAGVSKFLYLPDPWALYALMGALAANILEGDPVWLMLVGPPGCGKTELLNSLGGVKGIEPCDSIDGPAAFLSGTGKKETARNATGGLLNMVGLHGGIVIKDFTGVLSLEAGKRRLVLDCLRQIYDGKWARPVGSDGGKMLLWPGEKGDRGHVGVFAGVTNEIDQHHAVSASLGERWVYYRFDQGRSDQFARTQRAIKLSASKGWRREVEDMVTAFAMSLDLDFGKRIPRRELTDAEMLRVIRMASVAAMCRSSVPRDGFKHEVIGVPETETFTRIGAQLGQLYVGMEYVGVGERERWKVLGKVALDSMPLVRRRVIKALVAGKQAGYGELAGIVGTSETVVRRAVDDLRLHGAVEVDRPADGGKAEIRLSRFVEQEREWLS